ncbi:hypothetical protein V2W45_1328241 [Cenococcum geophilum]
MPPPLTPASRAIRWNIDDATTSTEQANLAYNFPNDENEQDRFDITHALFTAAQGGKLHLCPKPLSSSRILDIGTGTGIWAIDTGDLYPRCRNSMQFFLASDLHKVKSAKIGNDSSTIQPK